MMKIPAQRFRPEDITYELFGIDPAEFYRVRFAYGRGLANALANPFFHYEIGYEKFRRLIADLKTFAAQGARVLDVGCGAGTYGPTLIANIPGVVLYGIDMSEQCLVNARENGYAYTQLVDLSSPLPYPDAYFDFVFSMDVLGHVEFRHKDLLVSEIARVTAPRGAGHHGAETGFVDYFTCNPKDEGDPVRNYVLAEGHIGVEPVENLCIRFSRQFSVVKPHVTYLHPFYAPDAFARQFEERFQRLVAEHTHPEAKSLALLILGRLNQYFIDLYSDVFGAAFRANDSPSIQPSGDHLRAREEMVLAVEAYNAKHGTEFCMVPRDIFRAAGFASITVQK